jgi:hypothetical protein
VSRAVGRASFGVALAVLGLVACGNPPTGIAYVHERYRSEADVARASEAFHAKEHHGDDVVFRTQEKSREGYYFYIHLDRVPPPDGRLILEVVREENRPPERYDFSLKLLPRGWFGELVVGLTGREAGPPTWRPIAWRLSVTDAQGKALATRTSFLWGTRRDLGER